MIKYMTGGYCQKKLIEPVTIERETEKSIWIKSDGCAERKHTNYCQYHDSIEDAKVFLINKYEREIHDARVRAEYSKKQVSRLEEVLEKINKDY